MVPKKQDTLKIRLTNKNRLALPQTAFATSGKASLHKSAGYYKLVRGTCAVINFNAAIF